MSLEDCVWHQPSCQLHSCNMQVWVENWTVQILCTHQMCQFEPNFIWVLKYPQTNYLIIQFVSFSFFFSVSFSSHIFTFSVFCGISLQTTPVLRYALAIQQQQQQQNSQLLLHTATTSVSTIKEEKCFDLLSLMYIFSFIVIIPLFIRTLLPLQKFLFYRDIYLVLTERIGEKIIQHFMFSSFCFDWLFSNFNYLFFFVWILLINSTQRKHHFNHLNSAHFDKFNWKMFVVLSFNYFDPIFSPSKL